MVVIVMKSPGHKVQPPLYFSPASSQASQPIPGTIADTQAVRLSDQAVYKLIVYLLPHV